MCRGGRHGALTYPPINRLKAVADDVWIVDGPVIALNPLNLGWPFAAELPFLRGFPFSTRMTIMRLEGGGLLVHSPTALDGKLKHEVDVLGPVKWLVGPNRIHYWWLPDWHKAYPKAVVYTAPRLREQARGRIDFDTEDLDRDGGYPWDGEVVTLPVPGNFMTEVEFFHKPSRTLVLTDFIENFEPGRFPWWMRWMLYLGGVAKPHGGMPTDMRLTFSKDQKAGLKRAVETMLAWQPERVILAHGDWFERDGGAALRRAFGWLLD